MPEPSPPREGPEGNEMRTPPIPSEEPILTRALLRRIGLLAPTIAVSELADSSVNFVVRPWVATADYWAVKFDLTEQIKLALDANNISIPFPQRDVHLHQAS